MNGITHTKSTITDCRFCEFEVEFVCDRAHTLSADLPTQEGERATLKQRPFLPICSQRPGSFFSNAVHGVNILDQNDNIVEVLASGAYDEKEERLLGLIRMGTDGFDDLFFNNLGMEGWVDCGWLNIVIWDEEKPLLQKLGYWIPGG